MFEVRFLKMFVFRPERITGDKHVIFVQREETLPFVPVPGMQFSWDKQYGGHEIESGPLWVTPESRFYVYLKPEDPGRNEWDLPEFVKMVEIYLADGWRIADGHERNWDRVPKGEKVRG